MHSILKLEWSGLLPRTQHHDTDMLPYAQHHKTAINRVVTATAFYAAHLRLTPRSVNRLA